MRLQTLAILLLMPAAGLPQELVNAGPKFPESAFFRQHFETEVPKVSLRPPVRLADFVVGDRLELSLRSYLELVLANNTDLEVQRLGIEPQKNAITRAFGRFDPAVTASFRANRSNSPQTSQLDGAGVLSQLSQPYAFGYQQTLESGTQYNIAFNGQRSSTNNLFQTFNPLLTSNLQFNFTQPLLQNRGSANKIPIMLARSRLRQSEYQVEDQIMRLLQQAELAYWSVIDARETLRVQEEALRVSLEFLKRNQRELDLGAISPLEIYQPQQSYAEREVAVTQARYRLEQSYDVLRRQISADLDPQFRNMAIALTETVLPPADDKPLDREMLVESAYRFRPDLKAALQNLDINDLQFKQAKNRLLPDISLTGTYNAAGRGGTLVQRGNVFDGVSSTSQIIRVTPGGLGDALAQTFAFDFPTYGFGLSLRLPLRDRAGQADLADAVVNKRLNALRTRSTEQTIRQEVLNAATQVESSRAGIRLATVVLDFAQKRLEAEQKRYDLGVTTIFFVLDAQNALTRAQADVVSQSVQYRRSLLNLSRTTGRLLEERGVVIR